MQSLYVILLLIVVLTGMVAVYLWQREKKYFAGADVTQAEVIGHQSITDDDDVSLLYRPRYRYEYHGQVYQGESMGYSSIKQHEVGQIIPIYVQRDQPHQSILKGRTTESPLRVFRYVMLALMGGALFLLASFAVVNSLV